MNTAIRGIYNNGMIDLIEKPDFQGPVEVLIVFLENKKQVRKIRGLFKDSDIDYDAIEHDLKNLSRTCAEHILNESEDGK